jgi:hypothetical protein
VVADHGVAPWPEQMKAIGLQAGRIQNTDVEKSVDAALDARFGAQDWVSSFVELNLYLNRAALRKANANEDAVQREAARVLAALPGIYAAYPRHRIEQGLLPDTDMGARIAKGFHPHVSGDVVVVTDPFWITEEKPMKHNTTHGAPYAYDTGVPVLLAGWGIRAGKHYDDASPADVVPTFCALARIGLPSASEGKPLAQALK